LDEEKKKKLSHTERWKGGRSSNQLCGWLSWKLRGGRVALQEEREEGGVVCELRRGNASRSLSKTITWREGKESNFERD